MSCLPSGKLCLSGERQSEARPAIGFLDTTQFSKLNRIMIKQTIGIALLGVFGATAAEVGNLVSQSIQNHDLSFEADSKSSTLVIKDSRTKRTWTAG